MFKVEIPGWCFDEKRDPSFRYDDEPHEYWLNKEQIYGFSAITKAVGWVTPEEERRYTEESRYRGHYVHWCTRLDDEGDLHDPDVDYSYRGYLEGYRAFRRDYNFKPRLIEVPLYNPLLRYGVTPDREGLILTGNPAIVELKTGEVNWRTKYQTAAQDMGIAHWEEKPTYRRRFGVKLNVDGTYRVEEYKDFNDYDRWKCAVIAAQSNEGKTPAQKSHNNWAGIASSI